MKLKNAARLFDTMPVYDGYSGALLFRVQGSTFLENSAEGTAAARRIFSADPALVMPAHSVILALNELHLVGGATLDEWASSAIRKSYWVRKVTDPFYYLTPGQAAQGAAGTLAYGHKRYLRESVNSQHDSELDPVWEISVSTSLPLVRNMFLKSGTVLHLIRMVYNNIDGFMTCQADEVDEPAQSVTFTTSGVYDPVTDTYGSATVNVGAVFLDYSKSYSLQTQNDFKASRGDFSVVVAKSSITPKVNQEFSVFSGRYKGPWRILNLLEEQDSWNLHVRRA